MYTDQLLWACSHHTVLYYKLHHKVAPHTFGINSSCALQPLQNTTPKALYHSWLKLRLPHTVQPLIAGGADIAASQHAAHHPPASGDFALVCSAYRVSDQMRPLNCHGRLGVQCTRRSQNVITQDVASGLQSQSLSNERREARTEQALHSRPGTKTRENGAGTGSSVS